MYIIIEKMFIFMYCIEKFIYKFVMRAYFEVLDNQSPAYTSGRRCLCSTTCFPKLIRQKKSLLRKDIKQDRLAGNIIKQRILYGSRK